MLNKLLEDELLELVDYILSTPPEDITKNGLCVIFYVMSKFYKNLNKNNIGQIMYCLETLLIIQDEALPLANMFEYKQNQIHIIRVL